MAGSATFVWTEADYVAALRAQLWLGVTKRTWIVLVVLVLLGAIIAVLPLLFGDTSGGHVGPAILGATVALFLPLCLLSVSWHAPRTARRIFRQQPSLSEPVTVSWSEDALKFESHSGASTHGWAKMHYWTHRGGILLFAANERLHHVVPTRALGDAAADLKATAASSPATRR